jgi:hypothetical protein
VAVIAEKRSNEIDWLSQEERLNGSGEYGLFVCFALVVLCAPIGRSHPGRFLAVAW